jgi:putative transposase
MARQARLRLANRPIHVTQRGNNRAACFYGDGDYLFYLHSLAEQSGKYACTVHAYALMTNHVHLLITPEDVSGGSQLMKHLGQRYVQYFNRMHGRSGTLWEGRFRSSIVEEQAYLLRCYRYIELNPVRAGMVAHPRDYVWSSYRTNAEQAPSTIVTPHSEYLELAGDDARRAAAYRGLFESKLDDEAMEEIRGAARGGYVLGRRGFRAAVAAVLQRRVEPGSAGRPSNRGQTPIKRCQTSGAVPDSGQKNRGLSPI